MRQGHQLDDGLKDQIRSAIRKALSARHVPSFIFQVDDIPVRPHTNCTSSKTPLVFHKRPLLPGWITDVHSIFRVTTVHREREENRDCSQANYIRVGPQAQWHCGEPGVAEFVS